MTNDIVVIVEGCVSIAACGAFMGAVRAFQGHSRDHDQNRQALQAHGEMLQAQSERLERIEAEFWPNGGSSSRDVLEDLVEDVRRIADVQGVALPPRRSRPKPGKKP